MLGPVFTLMNRSLREDSRLLRSHLFRLLFLGLIVWMLYRAAHQIMIGAEGLHFFSSITFLNFFLITLVGASYFASAITEEKEERTLDLLKLTGMSPLSLLLGKFGARLIGGLLLLSVQFPFTWLAITLGGVTSHQVVEAYVALAAYLVFVASSALLASVISRHSSRATFLTGLGLATYLFAPAICGGIRTALTLDLPPVIDPNGWLANGLQTIYDWGLAVNVFVRLERVMLTGFAATFVSAQVIFCLSVAALCFGLAWLGFESFAQETEAPAPARGFVPRRFGRLRIIGIERAWSKPLIWKDFHFIAGGWTTMLVKLCLYFGLSLLPVVVNPRITSEEWTATVFFWMLFFAAVEILYYAGRIFHDEVHAKTLSSLMMLPLSVKEIGYSKISGCLLGLIPTLCILGGTMVAMCMRPQMIDDLGSFFDSKAPMVCAAVFLQFWFYVHLLVFLSLVIRWGVLPLTILCAFFVNFGCLTVLDGPDGADSYCLLMSFASCFGITVLHLLIGHRLTEKAGEA